MSFWPIRRLCRLPFRASALSLKISSCLAPLPSSFLAIFHNESPDLTTYIRGLGLTGSIGPVSTSGTGLVGAKASVGGFGETLSEATGFTAALGNTSSFGGETGSGLLGGGSVITRACFGLAGSSASFIPGCSGPRLSKNFPGSGAGSLKSMIAPGAVSPGEKTLKYNAEDATHTAASNITMRIVQPIAFQSVRRALLVP